MFSSLDREQTVVVVPENDAEAVQIIDLCKALQIPLLISGQPHGARLEQEDRLEERLRESLLSDVVIVEMPGPQAEAHLRKLGFSLTIVDHHRYDQLDRMTDPQTGKSLPSSLEQFLSLFKITDDEMQAAGFDPRLVRGVGALDRGFLWALLRDGYSESEVKRVCAYARELALRARGDAQIEHNEAVAKEAFENRKQYGEYVLIVSDDPTAEIRSLVSMMIAELFGKPTPLIISAGAGRVLYAQESPKALELYKQFGGFTFGQDSCWGYNNAVAKEKITIEEVLAFLECW